LLFATLGSPVLVGRVRGAGDLIFVPGSRPMRDINHKSDGRLPLLSTRLVVTF